MLWLWGGIVVILIGLYISHPKAKDESPKKDTYGYYLEKYSRSQGKKED
ncbi:hypothetical protein [Natroniella sp. ANB-PHB2]